MRCTSTLTLNLVALIHFASARVSLLGSAVSAFVTFPA